MPTAREKMTTAEIKKILAGRESSIPCTTGPDGVSWVWAGHVDEQIPGDGTAECEYMMARGYLDLREIDTCDCGCPDGRCYTYRVATGRIEEILHGEEDGEEEDGRS